MSSTYHSRTRKDIMSMHKSIKSSNTSYQRNLRMEVERQLFKKELGKGDKYNNSNETWTECDGDIQKYWEKKKGKFCKLWSNPPKANAELGDFDKIRTIGRGAFGRVMLVKHKSTNNHFALKILTKRDVDKSNQLINVLNEKNILACIDSDFIITLKYSFQDNSYLYLALEFVCGGEMFNLLRTKRRFPEPLVKFYGAQVLVALEYLHMLTIAYRDLKPENILINVDGYLKVADFGFAKIIPKDKRTWTLCGTPDYMAPEIILSKGYSYPVDWWAFGILLYEMTAGYPPFMHKEQMKTFEYIIKGKFKYSSYFTNELKDLLKNLITSDLTRRFGNLLNGVDDIKRHRYFSDFDFKSLMSHAMKAPYVPNVKSVADASAFDKWDEEPLKIATENKFGNKFCDF